MKQPLAYVHPDAKIANNVVIEPFVTIDKNVIIGEGTQIGSNVTILEGARIGKNCKIFPGAVISAIPQDLKFQGEDDRGNRRQYDTARMCHRKPGNRSQRKNHSGKQLFDYGLLTHRPRLRCRR